jgi:hypothetical protein
MFSCKIEQTGVDPVEATVHKAPIGRLNQERHVVTEVETDPVKAQALIDFATNHPGGNFLGRWFGPGAAPQPDEEDGGI